MNELEVMLNALNKSVFSILRAPADKREVLMKKTLGQFGGAMANLYEESLNKAYDIGANEGAEAVLSKLHKEGGLSKRFLAKQDLDFDGEEQEGDMSAQADPALEPEMLPADGDPEDDAVEPTDEDEQMAPDEAMVLEQLDDSVEKFIGRVAKAALTMKMRKGDLPAAYVESPVQGDPEEDTVDPDLEDSTPEDAKAGAELAAEIQKAARIFAKRVMSKAESGDEEEDETTEEALSEEAEKFAKSFIRRHLSKADEGEDSEVTEEEEEEMAEDVEKFVVSCMKMIGTPSMPMMKEDEEEEAAPEGADGAADVDMNSPEAIRRLASAIQDAATNIDDTPPTGGEEVDPAEAAAEESYDGEGGGEMPPEMMAEEEDEEDEAEKAHAVRSLRKRAKQLRKSASEIDLEAKIEKLAKQNAEMEATLAKLAKSTPAPSKGKLKAVDKGQDVTLSKGSSLEKEAARIASLPAQEQGVELIKFAFQNGRKVVL